MHGVGGHGVGSGEQNQTLESKSTHINRVTHAPRMHQFSTVLFFLRERERATSDAARRGKEWALGLLLFEGHTQDVGFKQLYVKGVCDRCLRRNFLAVVTTVLGYVWRPAMCVEHAPG